MIHRRIDLDLKQLKRADLLELLLVSRKENERLEAQLKQVTAQLQSKEILIARFGSIAEIALQLKGVEEQAERQDDRQAVGFGSTKIQAVEKLISAVSLLDAIHIQMGCRYLSDLRYLDGDQRMQLVRKLERLTPEEVNLQDWNDALTYLTGQEPQSNAAQAKAALISGLTARCRQRGE